MVSSANASRFLWDMSQDQARTSKSVCVCVRAFTSPPLGRMVAQCTVLNLQLHSTSLTIELLRSRQQPCSFLWERFTLWGWQLGLGEGSVSPAPTLGPEKT